MDLDQLLPLLLDAAKSGNASLIIAVILCLAVYLIRALVAPRVAFFSSDLGGASLAFLVSFSGAIVTALGSGASLSLSLMVQAAQIALTAMGGYSAAKKLFAPLAIRGLARLGVAIELDTFERALQASEPKQRDFDKNAHS